MELKKTEFIEVLEKQLEDFKDDEILKLAIKHFLAFVGANFAGIKSLDDLPNLLPDSLFEHLRGHATEELAFGINKPFMGTRLIEKLWLAKILLNYVKTRTFEWQIWMFRIYYIWSKILNEREIKLKAMMDEMANSIMADILNKQQNYYFEFLLERAHFQMEYFEFTKAKTHIDEATKLAGIRRLDLGGALGKRTQFQEKSLPQLTLELELDSGMERQPQASFDDLPLNCKNEDNTLLEGVDFDEKTENRPLDAKQTASILAMAIWERNSNSFARQLGHETTMVFLDEVIRQKCCWSIQAKALVERSKLEMKNSRRVERAAAQLESIANNLNELKDQDILANRFNFMFASAPIPFWEVAKLQANVLLSLGCTSDALRIFERLQSWNDVIKCYLGIGQVEKAEMLVRKLLEEKEEANYYCLLGQITNKPEYYQKISADRSAQARASLGKLMLARQNYPEALQHYKRSLEIQPLQLGLWFTLGYVSMKIGDFQNAVHAYHHCVDLEPEHFEAWNNLAASYIRLNQKQRAQKILQEALKLSWENAHVWENLLLISVDIGDFKQAIGALERLMDLEQKKPVDELPLEIIATEILESGEQPNVDVNELKNSLLGIFARANARQSLSPKLMRLYAKLKKPKMKDENKTAWSNYIVLLEKAFQRDFDQITSSKTHSRYCELLRHFLFLVDELQTFWKLQNFQQNQIKMQLQMRSRPIIGYFKKEIESGLENEGELGNILLTIRNSLL